MHSNPDKSGRDYAADNSFRWLYGFEGKTPRSLDLVIVHPEIGNFVQDQDGKKRGEIWGAFQGVPGKRPGLIIREEKQLQTYK